MLKDSLTSNRSARRQKAAERTNVNLLRYVLDHPNATSKHAATDLGMSFPNVCRLVAGFKASGILVSSKQRQTGKRGPWSQVIRLRSDLGCSIGVDLEATHIRGIVLDFANDVRTVSRRPISHDAGHDQIVAGVAEVAVSLTSSAREYDLEVCAVGLGLPGPVVDVGRGRVHTDLQFGQETLEFVPEVERACGVNTFAAANSYCFAAGHHRMNQPRQPGIDMVILNRFGLAATIVWNGQLYTGASHYAGDLGLLPTAGSQSRLYRDVCTGAALLRLARLREDRRPFQELIQSPDCPAFTEWLRGAVPAFAQAIYAAVIAYNPDRVLIEGIFNRFSPSVRRWIVELVTADLKKTANMLPEIRFFEGDDLMGARGAALLARDDVVDEAMIRIIRSSQER